MWNKNEIMVIDFDYKILVIEDEPLLSELIRELLASTEVFTKIDKAANGLEALVQLSKYNYDAIVLDIQMPILNGLEFIRRVVLDNSFSTEKILILSGNINSEQVAEAKQLGIKKIIEKPFSETDFLRSLSFFLN